MKMLTKLWLAVVLLSMGTVRAAQAPVQEPIPEIQWRQAGRAFLPGLYEKAGANSLVKQLPQYVAQDIVKFAKPKEEYGLIKNFADESIKYFNIKASNDPNLVSRVWGQRFANCSIWELPLLLRGQNRLSFKNIRNLMIVWTRDPNGCDSGTSWPPSGFWDFVLNKTTNKLFDVYFRCRVEGPRLVARSVQFFNEMNLNFYKEGDRIKLVVTSPNHDPISYYAEQDDTSPQIEPGVYAL